MSIADQDRVCPTGMLTSSKLILSWKIQASYKTKATSKKMPEASMIEPKESLQARETFSNKRRSSIAKGRWRRASLAVTAAQKDPITSYKNALELESLALATSLSPGSALKAISTLPRNPDPDLVTLSNRINIASPPLPLSKPELKAVGQAFSPLKQDPLCNLSSLNRDHSLHADFSTSGAGQTLAPILNDEDQYTSTSSLDHDLTQVTIWERIKNAQPKIPVQKRKPSRILPETEIRERQSAQEKADAIVNLLDVKRAIYHRQAQEMADEHLMRSQTRKMRLERILTEAEKKRQEEIERNRKKVPPNLKVEQKSNLL